MKRRRFALNAAGLASLLILPLDRPAAQEAGRLPKVAILDPGTPDDIQSPTNSLNGLLGRLAELGYVDGQNVGSSSASPTITSRACQPWRPSSSQRSRMCSGPPHRRRTAVAPATSTIPIVIAPVGEETMADLVSDFAHPPGNITALTLTSRERGEKCLQLLKEAVPGVRRVGVLFNPLNPAWRGYPDVLNDAARALGLELVRAEARGAPEVDQAFAAMAAQKVDAVFGLSDSTLIGAEPTPARIFELFASPSAVRVR